MSEEYLKRLRDAWGWFNDGQCCGQVDCVGICAAPACIFGEALKEFDKAAAEIARLRAEIAALQRDASQETSADDLVKRLQHLGDWQAADRIEAQAARIAELKATLDFYGCIDHYQTHNAVAPNVVQSDRGAKARAALGGKDE